MNGNGELVALSDLGNYLFGERSAANYKRALRLVQGGSIACIRTGTRIFVTKTEVERFMQSQKREAERFLDANAQRDSGDGPT